FIFSYSFFLSLLPPPPRSALFPYTTLFRSEARVGSYEGRTSTGRWSCSRGLKRLSQRRLRTSRGTSTSLVVIDGVNHKRTALKRSEEHTSELQSRFDLVCRLLLEKKKKHKT